MNIDHDRFLDWAESHFDSIKVKGNEIMLNSIFTDDTNHKLACNTNKNCFHCWKSGRKGNLILLVCEVEKCPYDEAIEKLGSTNSLYYLEQRVKEFIGKGNKNIVLPPTGIELPPDAYKLMDLAINNPFRAKAENFLKSRKIQSRDFMVCVSGKFKNRIVIPYYGKQSEIIYWNARTLDPNNKFRYMGPDISTGVGKGDVLWIGKWYDKGTRIYLCEGEFDAMSLCQCGIPAAASGGKVLSFKQTELLRGYKITLGFDNDAYGRPAIIKAANVLKESGFEDIKVVRAPEKYKDWSELLVGTNIEIVRSYLLSNEKELDILF